MGTPYVVVDNVFLDKITDDMLISMSEENLQKTLNTYRRSAAVKFKQSPKMRSYNTVTPEFDAVLTDEEIEILSSLMVIEWIRPRINSIELLEPTMSTKDYQAFSNANHLNSLQGLLRATIKDVDRLIVSYTYSENNLDGLGDR